MWNCVKSVVFFLLIIGCVNGQLRYPRPGVTAPLGHDLLSRNHQDQFPSMLHFQMPTQDMVAELATEGGSVSGLRQKLLERLLINNQLQQMTGQGTGSAMNFGSASFGAPSLGGANLGGGMFSAGGLSDPGMGLLDTSEPSNTKILSRSAAIQNLQRRLDAMRGNQLPENQLKGGIAFQTPARDQGLNDNIISQTRKETPNASVKITVKRTTKTSGGGQTNQVQAPSMMPAVQDTFSAASLRNTVPKSQAVFQSSPVMRVQPSSQPSAPPVTAIAQAAAVPTVAAQSAQLATASLANVAGAAAMTSASSVAAAKSMQNHISDMMDTKMDMMSDMAEAGMLGGGMMGMGMGMGGMGGLGGLGGMAGLSGLGGMPDMMGGLSGMGGMGMGMDMGMGMSGMGMGMGGLGMGGLMGGGMGGLMGGGFGNLGMMSAFT
nr:glycine, alanine and asparagine-rich protein isoform X4 [Crassostrea gigas]